MHSTIFFKVFTETLRNYTTDSKLINELWSDIYSHYTSSTRHYHNLKHLDHLTDELFPVREEITDWSEVVFAIAYHDIVYKINKNDNEEKSAAHAEKVLTDLLKASQVDKCKRLIVATKTHAVSGEPDINYFTDADLAIFGASSNNYRVYKEQIRKEYELVPEIIYKNGRKKVVEHFLKMNRIYKTDYFFTKYEQQARLNLILEREGKH